MVLIDAEYLFEGADGAASLLDLFDGRSQLIVQHFMFGPGSDAGCPSCSGSADEISPGLSSIPTPATPRLSSSPHAAGQVRLARRSRRG